MKYKQVQYMIIREEQANVMLIEKLRSFRKNDYPFSSPYLFSDLQAI